MAAKAKGLGKGLGALIPLDDLDVKSEIDVNKKASSPDKMIKISKIEPRKDQPRKTFNEDKLQELADSIKKYGIIEPIIVQDQGTYYEIVAGERRWRAAMKAGLKEVPVRIREFTEQEKAEISLIENIQREDLNPIEEALAYKTLLEKYNLKQDEVAERVSRSRTAVTNSLRLLKLDPRVQQNPGYLTIIILARVITKLGTLPAVDTRIVEGLFTPDLAYLQDLYQRINAMEIPVYKGICPHCGKEIDIPVNFTEAGV